MSNYAYIVFGSTGECSDRQEWPVVVYSNSMAADAHVDLAERWVAAQGIAFTEDRTLAFADYRPENLAVNPWDPHMQVDYTGVRYYVKNVPSRGAGVRTLV